MFFFLLLLFVCFFSFVGMLGMEYIIMGVMKGFEYFIWIKIFFMVMEVIFCWFFSFSSFSFYDIGMLFIEFMVFNGVCLIMSFSRLIIV